MRKTFNLLKAMMILWVSTPNGNPPSPPLPVQNTTPPPPPSPAVNPHNYGLDAQWPLIVIGACYAAVSATLQALPPTRPLTAVSQTVYVALVISLTAFAVSVYIRLHFPRASSLAVHVGSLFGSGALLVALVADLNTPIMLIAVAIYSSGIVLIIFVNYAKTS